MSPEEPGLFGDPERDKGPEEGAPSPFFVAMQAAAEALGAPKIGRPKGVRNRKDQAFEDYFYAKGFKDPAIYLAEIYGADPLALRAMVPGATMLEVLELQRKCASDLMPYLHGKKPIDVNVRDERLPTLILVTGDNQLDQARRLIEERQKVLSVGAPELDGEAKEIKDLEGGE